MIWKKTLFKALISDTFQRNIPMSTFSTHTKLRFLCISTSLFLYIFVPGDNIFFQLNCLRNICDWDNIGLMTTFYHSTNFTQAYKFCLFTGTGSMNPWVGNSNHKKYTEIIENLIIDQTHDDIKNLLILRHIMVVWLCFLKESLSFLDTS